MASGEISQPAAPTFSYAQAAKAASLAKKVKANPDSVESTPTTGSLTHTPDPERAESSSNNKDMNDISSVHSKMNGLLINDISHGNVNGSNGVSQLNGAEAAEEIVATSMPAPKASTESAEKKSESSDQTNTTVPSAAKEDDAFVTASNDSTDGTWENLSRSSQAGEKTRTKAEIGSDDDTKSWEHVEPVAQLKEAPPPAENIWKKRLAENKAKQPLKSADSNTERGNGASPNAAKNGEQGSADARRKSRPSQTVEEKPGFGKGLGDRARSGEEAVTRGVRSSTHQKASPPKAPLPPTSDEMFWPTPDLAKEEEKKKQQEKIEKTEKSEKELTPKSHTKPKFETLELSHRFYEPPYTKPSGSRLGGRGGRLGGAGRGGYSGEAGPNDGKPGGDTTGPPSSSERAKGDMGPPRPGPLGNKPKRSSSAGPHTAREQREQRKPGDASKHAADASSEPKHTPTQTSRETPRDSRRTSVATQTSDVHSTRQGSPTRRASGYYGGNQEGDQSYARTTPDRRYEESNRPDHYRDPNGYSSMRERGEGRGEARRGNYRGGRGGYNGAQGNYGSNNPSYTVAQGQPGAPNNMPAQQNNTAYTPTKAQSYSEQRHYSQPQVPPYSQPRENRHTRNNSRSQSIPNSIPPNNNPPLYARYSAAGGPLPSPNGLPLLHTDLANMYAYRPGSHPARGQSTAAFTPFMLGQAQLQGMVQTQMEYYFSVDNLCKDLFLRRFMDSQGFVPLSVLTNFNRIRQLTEDPNLVRFVCDLTPEIELRSGTDGIDRIRKAHGWEQWVLANEEREVSAQGESKVPTYHQLGHGYNGPISPNSALIAAQYQPLPLSPPNGIGPHHAQGFNFNPKAQIGDAHMTQTPLTANVPEFTPVAHQVHGGSFHQEPKAQNTGNSFSDEQVETLMIVVRKPAKAAASTEPHSLTNGTKEADPAATDISSEIPAATNGDHAPLSQDQTDQPFHSPDTLGPARQVSKAATSPVFFVKSLDKPVETLPSDLTHEFYSDFRKKALAQHRATTQGQQPRDMEILFQFWSHFLPRNFNTRMYQEFRQLAFDDARDRDSFIGLHNLIAFYDESILSSRVISDEVARDYVDLVRSEMGKPDKPAFARLRAALRNGALPLKNRVKVDKLLDSELKKDLER